MPEEIKDGSARGLPEASPLKKIYVVMIRDRHSDPVVATFEDRDWAISYARRTAKQYCRFPEDYKELDIRGWEFHAEYSCESDSVTVIRTTLETHSERPQASAERSVAVQSQSPSPSKIEAPNGQ
jgi:hypothetical protein